MSQLLNNNSISNNQIKTNNTGALDSQIKINNAEILKENFVDKMGLFESIKYSYNIGKIQVNIDTNNILFFNFAFNIFFFLFLIYIMFKRR